MGPRSCSLLATGGLVLAGAAPAGAHGFGQRYDLPVPLSLYLTGAAAAVAFSVVLLGLFMRGAPGVRDYPRVNLLRWRAVRLLAHPAVLGSVKVASVGLFLVFILAGLVGDQHPLRNLAPTLVWVVWWVGLSYVSALAGNLWVLINPWRALFGWAEALYRRVASGRELSLRLPYPERLGVWPGLLLYLAFAWVELVFPGRAVPANLAGLAVGYSAITWAGMFLFGKERWLRRGEAFSLAFGVLARFAPTELRVTRRAVCDACRLGCRDSDECINCVECFSRAGTADREWNLRPFAVGLLRAEPATASMMGLILLILSTVTFDGFMATPAWARLEGLRPPLLPGPDAVRLLTVQTVGLIAFPIVFLGVYLLVIWLMAAVSGRRSGRALAVPFAFTLVPIAIAYHLAHYLSFLVIQGQLIVPLASDPFGFGWNLFGTAGYRVNIAAVGARFAWYTAVAAIVAGHIVAVYLAHVLAVGTLGNRAPALRGQYPMTALMVGYTMVSLWILAQPIVESGMRPATAEEAGGVLSVPKDAVIPEPGTGRLRPVGEGKTARVRLTYRLLASKFHDGTGTTVADLLYAYAFAYRWSVRAPADRPTYDPFIAESTALIRERLTGLRVIRVETTARGFGEFKLVQETPVVEVYLTSGAGTPEEAGSIAPPWSTLPWHVIVLMEEAVIRGWAAFSKAEATSKGVEWLDLARTASLKDRMAALGQEFERRGYIPEPLKGLVSAEEARQRWAALRVFYAARGHLLVTNGPYILDKWSRDSAVLQVFRDLSYPLGVGSFDAYPIPRRAYISRVELRDGRVEITAEVEQLDKFLRSYALVRKPFQPGASTGIRPDVVVGRYVVVSPDGRVVRTGIAKPGEDAVFRVDLKGTLAPGRYVLLIALYLNDNAINPDTRRIEYVVPAGS